MLRFFRRRKKKDAPPMECVYAGPEEMARRWGLKKEKEEDPDLQTEEGGEPRAPYPYNFEEPSPMNDVYAGPGMFGDEPEEEPEDEVPAESEEEEGPTYPTSQMEGVYAGPPIDDTMARVYEGPPTDTPMAPVYAGPQMMLVYAGPQQMRGQGGAWGPVDLQQQEPPEFIEEEPLKEGYVRCPVCGAAFPRTSGKFCPECGTRIEEEA